MSKIMYSAIPIIAHIIIGAAICIFNELLKILRTVFDAGKTVTLICDMLFFFLSGLMCFLTSLSVNDGKMRVYLLLFSGLGFFIWRYTFARLFFKPATVILRKFCALLVCVEKLIVTLAYNIVSFAKRIILVIVKFSGNIFNKVRKNA